MKKYNFPNEFINELLSYPKWKFFGKLLTESISDYPLRKENGLVRVFYFTQKKHIPEYQKYSIDYCLSLDGGKQKSGSVLRSED